MAEKKAALHPLPLFAVSVEKKKMHAPSDPPPCRLPCVPEVIVWAFFNAGIFAFAVAVALVVTSISHPPSWLLPEPETVKLTDAEVDVAHKAGMLWCVCVVSLAAAGVLALALPRHRLLVAYAALLATAAGHCVWAGLYCMIVAAEPAGGRISFRTPAISIYGSGVIDLLCLLGLILRGGEE